MLSGRRFGWLCFTAACASTVDRPGGTVEDPLCAATRWYADADGDGVGSTTETRSGCDGPDGWVRETGDCDDLDPTVQPGAVEVLDGADQDCNGKVDDHTVRWDDDGDGWCEDTAVCLDGTSPGDCDDTTATRAPGAVELCNGVDDDCDGVGEVDADADGALACADCDDTDDGFAPGVLDVCDGADQNCDGVIDNGDADGDGWSACPLSGGQVDVLVVVDDGPRASDAQVTLAGHVDGWLGALAAGRRDWRIRVVPASYASAGVTVLPADPDAEATLAAALAVGTAGGAAGAVLDNVASTAEGSWHRPGAELAVLLVVQEDDGSATPLSELERRLRAVTPRGGVRVDVIGGGWTGCSGGGRRIPPTTRLSALAEATGGQLMSVCELPATSPWGGTWLPPVARDCDDGDATIAPGQPERCNGVDDDCNTKVDEDADGDLRAACADCDVTDPRVGGAEACDGVDNDCDGHLLADEIDADGDGVLACAGDCDDADAAIHPGAVEDCATAVDEDCDGHARSDATTRADADGDGYDVCAGDCDDADDTILPNAPEHRFDGADQDCDGLVDGADPDLAWPLHTEATAGRVEVDGPTAWFRLCGVDHGGVTISTDGWVTPGLVNRVDATPSVAELRSYAPFVAAGWTNLTTTGWTGGRFLADHGGGAPLWLVERPAGLTAVWDAMPTQGGGSMTTLVTLGGDDVEVAVLDAVSLPPNAMFGWSCDGDGWSFVDPTEGDPVCFDVTSQSAGSFDAENVEGFPVVATSACTP